MTDDQIKEYSDTVPYFVVNVPALLRSSASKTARAMSPKTETAVPASRSSSSTRNPPLYCTASISLRSKLMSVWRTSSLASKGFSPHTASFSPAREK